MSEEKEFLAGMAAKREGQYLIWNEEDQYIYVEDLPTELVDKMAKLPCHAATLTCQSFLGDFNIDALVNEGWI